MSRSSSWSKLLRRSRRHFNWRRRVPKGVTLKSLLFAPKKRGLHHSKDASPWHTTHPQSCSSLPRKVAMVLAVRRTRRDQQRASIRCWINGVLSTWGMLLRQRRSLTNNKRPMKKTRAVTPTLTRRQIAAANLFRATQLQENPVTKKKTMYPAARLDPWPRKPPRCKLSKERKKNPKSTRKTYSSNKKHWKTYLINSTASK